MVAVFICQPICCAIFYAFSLSWYGDLRVMRVLTSCKTVTSPVYLKPLTSCIVHIKMSLLMFRMQLLPETFSTKHFFAIT